MDTVGIIAEYDPFHKGHQYQLQEARARSGAGKVLCVMSGSFTQRGAPSAFSPHARAEMALRCGADAVFSLPVSFAVRRAETFALGGVYLLKKLGAEAISFGCETDDIKLLKAAAHLRLDPPESYTKQLKAGLDQGLPFAAAESLALVKELGAQSEVLFRPNNTLAISYLQAMEKIHWQAPVYPVLRTSDYHANELADIPSASAVRAALFKQGPDSVLNSLPGEASVIAKREWEQGRVCREESMDAPLLISLTKATPEMIAELPDVSEGLENRILACARSARTREALLQAIKTKRYPYARLSRILCHLLLGIRADELPPLPRCTRLLGYRIGYEQHFSNIDREDLVIYTNPAKEELKDIKDETRADQLRSLLCGGAMEEPYRQPPVIIK